MLAYLPPKEKSRGARCSCDAPVASPFSLWDLEGAEVDDCLNSLGFAAILVKYRVPIGHYGNDLNKQGCARLKAAGPVMDAQAMGLARARTAECGINQLRISIMGFSTGGETAGLTALLLDQRLYTELDATDEHSCEPSFAFLISPEVSMMKQPMD